jgi:aldehyde dehydrogenase (NAD+)
VTPTGVVAHVDAGALVGRLRATFDGGTTRPLAWRLEQLARLRALLVDGEAELLDALRADLGKPRIEAWATDLGIVVNAVDHTRRHLRRWTAAVRVWTPLAQLPAQARLVRGPLGVVLVIAPWNYPVHLLLWPMLGAIAAGNCVIGKPSELTPHTSAALAELVRRYLDPAAVAIVEGGPEDTQALLAERFDHIFYTGNGRVGQVVMEAAARHLTPVTLELGGKSPAIVAADADVEIAARRIAWGKFLNAGQTCIAPDYALVAAPVVDRFLEHLGATIREFYGDDPSRSADYGRIVDDRHFERLSALLADGRVVIGGDRDASSRYLAPTVLVDVVPESAVMRDEIFGPLLPVLPVDDVEAACRFVNARDRPLALYVFSESRATQQAVLDATQSGAACVNATMLHAAVPGLPFGGVGASGTGAYHGRATFETFTHRRAVLRRRSRPDPSVTYPPYSSWKERLIRRFL